ncbi:MAG: hypothetical protein JWN34_2235 [Bryobacterales bacterium]|nr:hypothetical protein [Bryobacterales bacterium]
MRIASGLPNNSLAACGLSDVTEDKPARAASNVVDDTVDAHRRRRHRRCAPWSTRSNDEWLCLRTIHGGSTRANNECPAYKETTSERLIRASDVATVSLTAVPNRGQPLPRISVRVGMPRPYSTRSPGQMTRRKLEGHAQYRINPLLRHDPATGARVPPLAALRKKTAGSIMRTMETGVMRQRDPEPESTLRLFFSSSCLPAIRTTAVPAR